MIWILFAILAPLFWSITNLIDDDLVLHRLRDPKLMLGITGLFAGIPVMLTCAFQLWSPVSASVIGLGIVVGILNLFTYYPYFKALESTHPANAILLSNVTPIIVLVCAYLFLGERLSMAKYLAIAMILLSVVIIEASRDGVEKRRMETKAFWWMMLASVGFASQTLLEKKLFMSTTTPMALILIMSTSFILGLLLFINSARRRALVLVFRRNGRLLTINQLLDLSAELFALLAIAGGSASIVSAIGATQAIFVLLLGRVAVKVFTKKQFSLAKEPPLDRIMVASLLVAVGLMLMT